VTGIGAKRSFGLRNLSLVSGESFPFCGYAYFLGTRLKALKRQRWEAPSGGHPSLAGSPLPPDPSKICVSAKWEHIGSPVQRPIPVYNLRGLLLSEAWRVRSPTKFNVAFRLMEMSFNTNLGRSFVGDRESKIDASI
jgi:hypothetical protein